MRVLGAALKLGMVALLLGCALLADSRPQWDALRGSDLVGVWMGSDGGYLEFHEDHTFDVTDMPRERWSTLREGAGSWNLHADMNLILLHYQTSSSMSQLRSWDDDGTLKLYVVKGDPDAGQHYVFSSAAAAG